MAEIHVTVSPSQRDMLVQMLEERLREKRVEVRRARYSFEYRKQLESDEQQMQELLGKFSAVTAAAV